MSEHLWEIKHDYYGPDGGGYFCPGTRYEDFNGKWPSWDAFRDGGGFLVDEAYADLNVLWRWDWQRWFEDADYDGEGPGQELELFWILPRKGIIRKDSIAVTEADEDAVRPWLSARFTYLRSLWQPLADTEETSA